MPQLVSVIVPVYNIEKYIEHCIKSILAQTYKDLELILVNDGSIDNSRNICEKYAALDFRVKIVDRVNGGLSAARNTGMDLACGEWILFVDGDDWIEEDCIYKCMKVLKEKTDIVMFPYVREYANKIRLVKIFDEEYREFDTRAVNEYLVRRLIGPIGIEIAQPNRMEDLNPVWNKLYRRNLIKNIRFVDTKEIGTEDLWFNILAFKKAQNIIFTKNTYYHYNKNNEEALTRRYNYRLFPGWLKLYDLIQNFIHEYCGDEEFVQALNNRKVINLLALIRNVVSSTLSNKEKREQIKQILSNGQYSIPFQLFDFSQLNIIWKLFYKSCMNKQIGIVYFMVFIAERVKQYS